MAVKATFIADFTAFTQGVERAETKLRTFESGIGRIDKDLARFGNQFSGVKLIQQATLMEKAIADVGGVSRLTSSELEHAGNTAAAAAAKMKALGLEVPQRLQDLAKHAKSSTTELTSLSNVVSKIGPALAATFSIGAVVNFAKDVGAFAGKMVDLSAQTGITTTRLQALNYVAAGAGLTIEDITGGVEQLGKRLAGGDTSAASAVQRLNLSVYQLQQLAPDQAFIAIAKSVAQIENPMERTRTAMELFGRSGARMLRVMTDDLDGMIDKAEESGAVISEQLIKKADEFDDAWTQAILRVKATLVSFVAEVPSLVAKLNPLTGNSPQGAASSAGSALLGAAANRFFGSVPDAPGSPVNPFVRSGGIPLPDPEELSKQNEAAIRAFKIAEIQKKLNKEAAQDAKEAAEARAKLVDDLNSINDQIDKLLEKQEKLDLADSLAGIAEGNALFSDRIDRLTEVSNNVEALGLLEQANKPSFLLDFEKRQKGFDFGSFLQKNLGSTILSAVTGGGNVAGGIGSLVGSGITEKLFGGNSGLTKSISGGLSKVLGSTIGGALSSALPGIGALLGPAISGIGKLFGKLFGGEAKETNRTRDSALAQFGSQDDFRKLAAAAGVADAEIRKVFSTSKVKDFEAALRIVTGQIDQFTADQQADAQRLSAAIDKYGFSFEQAGAAFQKTKLDEQARELIEDWRVLAGAGIDLTLVNEKMSGAINEYLQTAVRVGQEIPKAFRPILQKMLEQGTLTDEAGNAITDLEAAGIQFSESMSEGFDRVIGKLDELIAKLVAAGTAMESIGGVNPVTSSGATVPVEDTSQYPAFTHGTGGRYLNFGKGTPVMLHGRERVMTESEGAGDSAGAIVSRLESLEDTMRRAIQRMPIDITNALMTSRA